MSRHSVLLDSAGNPIFSSPILNPDGQKIIDVVTKGNDVAAYTAQLADADQVGDTVLIRFSFNIEAPAGQSFQLAGLRMSDTPVGFVTKDTALQGFSLKLIKDNDVAKRPAALSLQFLGHDWLVLASTKGWAWAAI